MRRTPLAAIVVTAMLVVAHLSAQSKPNFSGKWTRDDTGGQRATGSGGIGFSCGVTCTITQDASTLRVERAQGDQVFKSEFKLDGTESKNQAPGAGGMTEVVTVAKWDGNKVTFTTKRNAGGTAYTIVQTISLQNGNLVLESSTDRGQGPQTTPATTYKKQ